MWEGIEIGIKIITLLFELLKLPTPVGVLNLEKSIL